MRALLVFALTSLPFLRAADSASPLPPVQGYRLAWSEEFDGASFDTSRWAFRTDERMWSRQKAGNISVRDGKLILSVKKEPSGEKQYSGAGIISRQRFLHGYYEARLNVPPGAGWHTSFWLMRHDDKGDTDPAKTLQELDICENDSMNPRAYRVNVH